MPLTASAVFILNAKGDSIIHRVYRDEVERDFAEAFRSQVLTNEEAAPKPVHQVGETTFMYTRVNNLYVVLATNANANAASSFKFLHDMVDIFKCAQHNIRANAFPFQSAVTPSQSLLLCLATRRYFNTFNENAIRNNFVIIYELLDEIMDYGLPQVLSYDLLKTYITQDSIRSRDFKQDSQKAKETSMQVTGSVGWRPRNIKYKKNEVYLDVIENISMLMSSQGSVLRSEVNGRIMMRCYLSGMPEIKLGLNDKLALETEAKATGSTSSSGGIALEDLKFHQCVNLSRFQSEKAVTFTPPDGEFELLRYRVSDGLTLPFRVLPIVKELGRTRLQMNVKLKSNFASNLTAMKAVARIPVPKTTAGATIDVSRGKAKYKSKENSLVWKVPNFVGQAEHTLNAEVELVSTMSEKKHWSRPPISLEFTVPMFAASGMKVRFLKVTEKSGYDVTKWIRYLTAAGGNTNTAYEVRTS